MAPNLAAGGVTSNPSELRTPRLLLRAWRDSDLAPFAVMNADPRVMEHFPAPMDRSASDAFAARLMDQHARHGFTMWAAEVVESERGPAAFIGFVGLMETTFDPPFVHAEDPCIEIGWRLAAHWWGMGLAGEGAAVALDHALVTVGLPEVVSFTVTANARSRAVMERIGMAYDGEFDHPRATSQDRWRRHLLYRVGRGSGVYSGNGLTYGSGRKPQ